MNLIALLAAAVLVGIDQLIKLWALDQLAPVGTMPLIQDVLHLTYVENRGAAFSIMQGQKWFLVGVTSIIVLVALIWILSGKIKSRFLLWNVALMLAGGLGNLVDRIFRGFVVDYIDFRLIHFAVFNFADCCVVIGVILIAVYILILEPREKKRAAVKGREQS